MNTLVIVLIAAVILFGAYVVYGRWLANKWGIDPKAETPAVKYNDGKDFVPTNGWTVFSHQFSSIAGAGPVTGAIQAAAFGWLPVLLWILIGGVFFGAVTDFGALYASVKNEGKSMGMIIEKYIGKFGRKIFLLFCWLFTLIVIAAFADMVAGTFNAYTVVDGQSQLSAAASTNGSAGMVSIMFMVFAVVFGLIQKKLNLSGWKEAVLGIVFIIAAFAVGMFFPLEFNKDVWSYITFVYIFFAAVMPMWLMKQPRDYMTTFMFICMIVGAAVGLVVAHPSMNLPVYTGFNNAKLGTMFPILFVTVACGAVSGFHSLVSSGTSSTNPSFFRSFTTLRSSHSLISSFFMLNVPTNVVFALIFIFYSLRMQYQKSIRFVFIFYRINSIHLILVSNFHVFINPFSISDRKLHFFRCFVFQKLD